MHYSWDRGTASHLPPWCGGEVSTVGSELSSHQCNPSSDSHPDICELPEYCVSILTQWRTSLQSMRWTIAVSLWFNSPDSCLCPSHLIMWGVAHPAVATKGPALPSNHPTKHWDHLRPVHSLTDKKPKLIYKHTHKHTTTTTKTPTSSLHLGLLAL